MTWAVDRVDLERGPDDDVAEVVGPGDRRDDDHEAERRALVGAGEVDLAGQVERVACRRRRRRPRCRSGWRPGRPARPARRGPSSPALASWPSAASGQ